MNLITPFDATTVDPTQGAGQMPVGKHPVIIAESEIKATKNQNGGLLELSLAIIDGPNKGQTGPYRLNLYNPNPQAAAIAQRQLSAICHVTNVFKVSDSSQLHNIPFVVEVGYQAGQGPDAPAGPENKGYTEVKRVFDVQGNEPGKPKANTAPQPAAQAFAPPASAPAAAPGWALSAPGQAPSQPPAAAPGWAAPAPAAPASFPPAGAAPVAPWNQAPAAPGGTKPPWG